MDKPTIGRIVHYYEKGLDPNGDGPYAAIVSAVHSENCVTLAVLVPCRTSVYAASSVSHKDVNPNMSQWWEWPPRA